MADGIAWGWCNDVAHRGYGGLRRCEGRIAVSCSLVVNDGIIDICGVNRVDACGLESL